MKSGRRSAEWAHVGCERQLGFGIPPHTQTFDFIRGKGEEKPVLDPSGLEPENFCSELQYLNTKQPGMCSMWSLDNWVTIVTEQQAGRPGFESRQRQRFFSSPRPDRLWAPPSLLTDGYRGLFPRG